MRPLRRIGHLAMRIGLACVCAAFWPHAESKTSTSLLNFSRDERAAIQRHGPWPPAASASAADAVGHAPVNLAAARALGEALFFDTRLSPSARVACATCHQPQQAFADGLARARGLAELPRNSPSLWNSVFQRWQAWDGGADSLWAQAIRPLLDEREMGSSAAHIRQLLIQEAAFACRYGEAFGYSPADSSDEAALVHAAQALAAFVATLVSPPTPFDQFRDALARGDRRRAARYPLAAQQGLRLFIGKAQCSVCHLGPLFSNGEFADTGLPFFAQPGVVDAGRHAGIEALRASPYTRLSAWARGAEATPTRHLQLLPRNFGEFKVPSLRHVAQTAPYMHDGQLTTLEAVIRHYDQINLERLHADGEQILKPLDLSADEQAQLLAFLQSLSAPGVSAWRPARSLAPRAGLRCAAANAGHR